MIANMRKTIQLLLFIFLGSQLVFAANSQSDFQSLKGKWQRPDGGYILEINSIEKDGKMNAGYFNPNSIHIAKAEASRADGKIKVFIELRDVNYPGSNYHLNYDLEKDILTGTYFQAVAREEYPVYFQRLKSS